MYLGTKCRPVAISVITSAEIATKNACTIQFNQSLAFNETQTFELRQRVSGRPQVSEYQVEFRIHAMKCHADWHYLAEQKSIVPLLPKVKVRVKKYFIFFTFPHVLPLLDIF